MAKSKPVIATLKKATTMESGSFFLEFDNGIKIIASKSLVWVGREYKIEKSGYCCIAWKGGEGNV